MHTMNTQYFAPVDFSQFKYPTASAAATATAAVSVPAVQTQMQVSQTPLAVHPQQLGAHSYYYPHQQTQQYNYHYGYQSASPVSSASSNSSFDAQRQMRIENHRSKSQTQKYHQLLRSNSDPLNQAELPAAEPPRRRYKYKSQSQKRISATKYVPADPSANVAQFSREDLIIIKNILPMAEIHKWNYLSNKLSKLKSKKLNSEFCIDKFHQMYNLPFNKNNSPLDSNYTLRANSEDPAVGKNYEGLVGSSLGYILSSDGWNLID